MSQSLRSSAVCSFLIGTALILANEPAAVRAAGASADAATRPNILLITADDMNYDTPGFAGNPMPGMTPNLDRLASESLRFVHAHVTIAVCQPSRSVLMTGRYPCRNGAEGFEPIRSDVPTLTEQLHKAGYFNGIFGKHNHLEPVEKFCWDVLVPAGQLGQGRDPARYHAESAAFFAKAREEGKPFFLMANSHDPHRPFAGSQQEARWRRGRRGPDLPFPSPGRTWLPANVRIPGFLPDLPDIRTELAQFYASAHRCDETIGAVLRALREAGAEDNTLVMFLSDNGMAFPFAKTNCYLTSTRTPWLVRWPGMIAPGVNDGDLISGIDFMPTILEAAGLPKVPDMDGRSFLPLLRGESQAGRDRVFTVFHRTSGKRAYPMRCLQDRRYGYILNAWSDGQRLFKNESQSGLTFDAMQRAARKDADIAARVKLFQYRVPEEFYDFERDPDALHNLVDDPAYADKVAEFRTQTKRIMASIGDPLVQEKAAGGK